MFDTVLFDLDGTLTDPFEGISNSIIYALKKFGIAAPDKPLLKKFIGPPLTESFSEYCGLNHSDALRAVDYYREYFSVAGIFENKPYEGVCELLSGLKERGYTAIVATSKPEQFAKAIVQHFGLEQYFKEVCGATMDQSRTQKADVIAYSLSPKLGANVFKHVKLNVVSTINNLNFGKGYWRDWLISDLSAIFSNSFSKGLNYAMQ